MTHVGCGADLRRVLGGGGLRSGFGVVGALTETTLRMGEVGGAFALAATVSVLELQPIWTLGLAFASTERGQSRHRRTALLLTTPQR